MMLSGKEKSRLRDLAKQVDEIIRSPRQRKIKDRFRKINSLGTARPPIAVFVPWDAARQLFVPDSALTVENKQYAWIERSLLYQINQYKLIPADIPFGSTFFTGCFKQVSPWMDGYKTVRANSDGTGNGFEPCLKEYDDIKKMKFPQLTVDHAATNKQFDRVTDLFGDILTVKKGQPYTMADGWGDSMIDQLVEMRGLEQFYYDTVDAPEFVHEVMRLMTDGKLALMKQYEEQNILVENNDSYIGSCSCSFTDELPRAPMGTRMSFRDLWGFAQAQELSGVSVKMLEEFVLPYQAEVAEKFGLFTYGCCEPMDTNIDTLGRHFPNLRILSISPFSNLDIAAEKCRGRYVMACKVHPSLAADYSLGNALDYLRQMISKLKGCSATISFAEIMSWGNDPTVFSKLAQNAQQVLDEMWEENS